jgi:hypothetical protein
VSDGGAVQSYAAAISFAGDGQHTLVFWSVDTSGHTEVPQTLAISIDTVPPVTTASVSGQQLNQGLYAGPVIVTLTATDAGSGVGGSFYQIDGGTVQQYTQPVSVSGNANHMITYYSVDIAGNPETPKSLSVVIIRQPSVSATLIAKGANSSGFYVSVLFRNSGGGVARNVVITNVTLRTLAGSGSVTYGVVLAQNLPWVVGDISSGGSTNIKM